METNLAYAGGGDNRFGDVMNIGTTPGTLTAGTSAPGLLIPGVTGAGQVCRGDNASMNTHGRGCFWEPADSNPTTSLQTPSTATDGGVSTATRQFGLLYNWCAAMGGQPAACQTTAATPADPTINICPAGWRLPTGGVSNNANEFWNLNQAINNGLNTPVGLLNNSLFQYSGLFGSGSFTSIGIVGFYWSSTVFNVANSRVLNFSAGSVGPADGTNRGFGLTVRCVRE